MSPDRDGPPVDAEAEGRERPEPEGVEPEPEGVEPEPEGRPAEAEGRERKPWTVRTDPDFFDLAGLPAVLLKAVLALEWFARLACTCYPGNGKLEERSGMSERSLEYAFKRLEALGWIERVMPPPACPGRTGFILLKRLHRDSPAADTPEKRALARASLREQREERTVPGGRRPERRPGGPPEESCGRTARRKLRAELRSLSLKNDAFPSEGDEDACNQRQRPGPVAKLTASPEGTDGLPPAPAAALTPAAALIPAPALTPAPPLAPAPAEVPAAPAAPEALESRQGPAAAPAAPEARPTVAGPPESIPAYLEPAERAVWEAFSPGKRSQLAGAPPEVVRAEVRQANPQAPPAAPTNLLEALEALEARGPALLSDATGRLLEQIGDHSGSWPYLHQQLGRVAAGSLPAAVVIDALKCWRAQMAAAAEGRRPPITNPAGYFTETLKEKIRRAGLEESPDG